MTLDPLRAMVCGKRIQLVLCLCKQILHVPNIPGCYCSHNAVVPSTAFPVTTTALNPCRHAPGVTGLTTALRCQIQVSVWPSPKWNLFRRLHGIQFQSHLMSTCPSRDIQVTARVGGTRRQPTYKLLIVIVNGAFQSQLAGELEQPLQRCLQHQHASIHVRSDGPPGDITLWPGTSIRSSASPMDPLS